MNSLHAAFYVDSQSYRYYANFATFNYFIYYTGVYEKKVSFLFGHFINHYVHLKKMFVSRESLVQNAALNFLGCF